MTDYTALYEKALADGENHSYAAWLVTKQILIDNLNKCDCGNCQQSTALLDHSTECEFVKWYYEEE